MILLLVVLRKMADIYRNSCISHRPQCDYTKTIIFISVDIFQKVGRFQMEFACILKLAFMAALVRLSSQEDGGLYFKNRFRCTLNGISFRPLALSISPILTILSIVDIALEVPNPIMHIGNWASFEK